MQSLWRAQSVAWVPRIRTSVPGFSIKQFYINWIIYFKIVKNATNKFATIKLSFKLKQLDYKLFKISLIVKTLQNVTLISYLKNLSQKLWKLERFWGWPVSRRFFQAGFLLKMFEQLVILMTTLCWWLKVTSQVVIKINRHQNRWCNFKQIMRIN